MGRSVSEHHTVRENKTNIWNTEANLRNARRRAGYSGRALSELVGISCGRLYEIENKQTGVMLSEIELFAQVLNADPDYLKDGLRVVDGIRHRKDNEK